MNILDKQGFVEAAQVRCDGMARDQALKELSARWMRRSFDHRYGYNFQWAGQPIMKYPQDILMLQMLIHSIRPEVVIECGIAFGGSLLFVSDMQRLFGIDGIVIGIEQRLLDETREATAQRRDEEQLILIESDSAAPSTRNAVAAHIPDGASVMVLLDSDHTCAHVAAELELYASLVTLGSYLIVYDTFIEILDSRVPERKFGPGDSPATAVAKFLDEHPEFAPDRAIDERLLISEAPSGYLKRVSSPT